MTYLFISFCSLLEMQSNHFKTDHFDQPINKPKSRERGDRGDRDRDR